MDAHHVQLYDPKSNVNWLCPKCNSPSYSNPFQKEYFRFGKIPDENGVVECGRCGNTNSSFSQRELARTPLEHIPKNEETSKRILSGTRATGKLHLGNYFGSLRQFVELQETDNSCLFFVADLHALTEAEGPIEIEKNTIEVVRTYLACGIKPTRSLIYRQSDVPEIPYLANLLGMITPESWLRRCTTYKDKKKKQKNPSLGLLSYPVLMAADILIARAEVIPVGEDQKQHLEIVRDIATKFNRNFGDVFIVPEEWKGRDLIRVPGLDGTGKMGKSDGNIIALTDTPKTIRKKVQAAVTDSGPVKGQEMTLPMQNLYYLMKLCSPPDIYSEYLEMYQGGEQRFYGDLKRQLADDIIAITEPIRERFNSPQCSDKIAEEALSFGKDRIRSVAIRVFDSARCAFGFRYR